MNLRLLPAGAAAGFLTMIAVGPMPAAATPCTNLTFLQLQQSIITSAKDTTFPGVPAFCRVTATLKPTSDSTINIEVWLPEKSWNGRLLGIGGGGFQGPITNREYSELATGVTNGFATDRKEVIELANKIIRMLEAELET